MTPDPIWGSLLYIFFIACCPGFIKSVKALMHDFPIRRQNCNKEYCRSGIYIDPLLIWDTFPCPPPGKQRLKLLLRVNWTGCLGPIDGRKVLLRTANRCHIELPDYYVLSNQPAPAVTFDSSCDTYCHLAIVLVCLCVLFLILVIVVVILYRKTWRKGKPESPTTETTLSYRENKYYTRNGCPVLDGSTLVISRPYETHLVGDRAESRLSDDVISNHYAPVDISYGRIQYERPLVNLRIDEPCHSKRHCGRDRTSSSSGSTDKSHVYEYITDHGVGYQESIDPGGASSDYCGDMSPENDEAQGYQSQRRSKHGHSPYYEQNSDPYEHIPCLQTQTLNVENNSPTLTPGRRKHRRRKRRPSSTASIKSESTTLSDSSFRSSRDPALVSENSFRPNDTGTINENPVLSRDNCDNCLRSRNSTMRRGNDHQRFPQTVVVSYNPCRMPCDSNYFRSRGLPIGNEHFRVRDFLQEGGNHSRPETVYGSNCYRDNIPPSGGRDIRGRETPSDSEYCRGREIMPGVNGSQRSRDAPAIIECSTFRSNVPITNGTLLTSTLAFK